MEPYSSKINAKINAQINTDALPPMLKVYIEYKEKYQDALLFFQVGDFYELFFNDAVIAAKALNLTLTSRDKSSENPIPMCGVPIGVIDNYVEKLISQGRSAAIVKQVSDPSAKKGMVDRELERIVTPGIRVLGAESKSKEEVYIAAVSVSSLGEEFSLAYSDVRTGKISVQEALDRESLLNELRFILPAELVLPREHEGKRLDRRSNWVKEIEAALSRPENIKFREQVRDNLRGDSREFPSINGYISLSELSKKAVQILIHYVDETTVTSTLDFTQISRASHDEDLLMDASTRKHLELVSNVRDGGLYGTLLSVIDQTVTAQGGRALRQWLLRPSRKLDEISDRQEIVQYFIKNQDLRSELIEKLSSLSDLERIATRIELSAANPRELAALKDSLVVVSEIESQLSQINDPANYLKKIREALPFPSEVLNRLTGTLTDSPPATMNECGIIRQGVDSELDRLCDIRLNGKSWLAELEAKEKARTGISSLKIRFNNVFGYFIEITKANLDKTPSEYIRKQTMVNAERFITEDLKKYEEEILSAEGKQLQLEQWFFLELLSYVKHYTKKLRAVAEAASLLDLFLSLATVAERDNLIRPEIINDTALNISNGKHPVLAKELESDFVPNSISMEPQKRNLMILTGPNMGGKSTYLRQAAQIVILAQMGSFIPAESAVIGLVDKIFTRIGASDNMLEGESTFMVEMREMAFILANATHNSLLLIDELGRGTATQDGLSIAQSTVEWLVERVKARTLFATHFHELTELEGRLPGVHNLSVGSKDIEGQIIFTHAICEGPANKSYGLEVAKIAGLPKDLIDRSREILQNWEAVNQSNGKREKQLSMFLPSSQIQNVDNKVDKIIDKQVEKLVEPPDYKRLKTLSNEIERIEVDTITPMQALNILSKLKESKKMENHGKESEREEKE